MPWRPAADESRTAEQVARLAAEATGCDLPASLALSSQGSRSSSSSPSAATEWRRRRLSSEAPRWSARSTARQAVARGGGRGRARRRSRRLGDADSSVSLRSAPFSSSSLPATHRPRTTSRRSRRSACAPHTPCARARVRAPSRSSSSARVRCSRSWARRSRSCRSRTRSRPQSHAWRSCSDAERLAVYLREGDRLYAAAGLGLAGPHVRRGRPATRADARAVPLARASSSSRRAVSTRASPASATPQPRPGSRRSSRCRCWPATT